MGISHFSQGKSAGCIGYKKIGTKKAPLEGKSPMYHLGGNPHNRVTIEPRSGPLLS